MTMRGIVLLGVWGGGQGEDVVCLGFLGGLGVVVGFSLNRQPSVNTWFVGGRGEGQY